MARLPNHLIYDSTIVCYFLKYIIRRFDSPVTAQCSGYNSDNDLLRNEDSCACIRSLLIRLPIACDKIARRDKTILKQSLFVLKTVKQAEVP